MAISDNLTMQSRRTVLRGLAAGAVLGPAAVLTGGPAEAAAGYHLAVVDQNSKTVRIYDRRAKRWNDDAVIWSFTGKEPWFGTAWWADLSDVKIRKTQGRGRIALVCASGGAAGIVDIKRREHTDSDNDLIWQAYPDDNPHSIERIPHNGSIPSVYTCDGVNTLPPLTVSGMPKGTETLVVLMDDPDIPETIKASRGVQKIDHFGRYNIPADTAVIEDASGDPVLNSRGEEGFIGPCPPPEYEPKEHRYIFRLYALPERLSFNGVPSLDEVEAAAKERAIASAELIGRYQRE